MALKGTGTPGEAPRIGGRGKAGQTDALKKVEPRERVALTAPSCEGEGPADEHRGAHPEWDSAGRGWRTKRATSYGQTNTLRWTMTSRGPGDRRAIGGCHLARSSL
jgi:hypothetical protein